MSLRGCTSLAARLVLPIESTRAQEGENDGNQAPHPELGSFDRAVRAFVIAPVAIGIAFGLGATSIGAVILLAVAGIALATGATGVCPGYVPFGIDTRGRRPLPHRPLNPNFNSDH